VGQFGFTLLKDLEFNIISSDRLKLHSNVSAVQVILVGNFDLSCFNFVYALTAVT
jgi:hypothetical protein